MFSKRSVEVDGPDSRPVRTSDRLKSRPKHHSRSIMYYTPSIMRKKKKAKTRASASQIVKLIHEKGTPKANV